MRDYLLPALPAMLPPAMPLPPNQSDSTSSIELLLEFNPAQAALPSAIKAAALLLSQQIQLLLLPPLQLPPYPSVAAALAAQAEVRTSASVAAAAVGLVS